MQNNHEDAWICDPHSAFSVMSVYLDTRQTRGCTWGLTLNVYIVESLHSLRLRDAVVGSKRAGFTNRYNTDTGKFRDEAVRRARR